MQALTALRLPVFRRIAAAYTINELGNWIGDVALAILVFNRTGSPLATATLFLSLRFAPAVLAPLLASRVEVIAPRQILPVLYLGEALLFVAIAVLSRRFSLPPVLILAALDGILGVAARALIKGVTVSVLGTSDLLRRGNAVINLGTTITGALGPLIAGGLVAAAGPGAALVLDAATFGAAALIVASTTGLRMTSNQATGTWGRLRAALLTSWRSADVRWLLIGSAAALMFGAAVIPIEVVFAKRTLHAGDFGYGLLMTTWGIGMVIGGAVFASALKIRLLVVISTGMLLITAGYAGLALSPDLVTACAFSAVGGAGNGLWATAVLTAVQQASPVDEQTGIMALVGSINQVMPAAGFLLGGAVTAVSSTRLAYAVSAGGIAVIFVTQTFLPTVGVRRHGTTPTSFRDSATRQHVRD